MASFRSVIQIINRNYCKSFTSISPTHTKCLYRCLSSSSTSQFLRNKQTADPGDSPKTEPEEATIVTAEQKEIESLKKELNDFKDKYQRTLADRENVRNRLQNEIKDAKLYGIQGFCKDLLGVTDVFRKAIESVGENELQEGGTQLKTLHGGLLLTETQLHTVLRRHGLQKVQVKEGDAFDPENQEVVCQVPLVDGSSPGAVATVFRDGWALHERCIRSAQVGVFQE